MLEIFCDSCLELLLFMRNCQMRYLVPRYYGHFRPLLQPQIPQGLCNKVKMWWV